MQKETKGRSALKCVGIVVSFWLLILFGPVLILLLSWVSNLFRGTSTNPGGIGYLLLQICSQAVACVMACSSALQISSNRHNICVLVNEIIAVCLFVLLALYMLFISRNWSSGISDILSASVLIAYAINTAKALAPKEETVNAL